MAVENDEIFRAEALSENVRERGTLLARPSRWGRAAWLICLAAVVAALLFGGLMRLPDPRSGAPTRLWTLWRRALA